MLFLTKHFSDDKHRNCISGFTLVEALIAVVLIVIGIGGALAAVSAGVRAQATGEFYSRAAFLSQYRMAELESLPTLSIGIQKGDFSPEYPDYSWQAHIKEGPEGLWLIEFTITQDALGRNPRSADISTYILRRNE